ncbi:MAG TPA: orotidine-5'-phosphate decarboxylase [Candidatus Polarisedimenticolia bacterium]|nr:orotidine-5'-phosphate decarboxylase [Candidatus Polarisedimenticolia bacterium]
MTAADRLIVALDVNSRESALSLVAALRPRVSRYKVGMELFTAAGPSLVRDILEGGGQVFLDLKFHDIPNTAARASVEAARLGVGMFTIHLSGGAMMARRVADEVEAHCQVYRLPRPKILGVTVLSSLTAAELEEVGVLRPLDDQVAALASLAKTAGLDGVVASPREAGRVRETCGRDFLVVTPGVRPRGSDQDDQSRTLTPREAIEAGADYIVVGRPIIRAHDPLEAVEAILMEMDGA